MPQGSALSAGKFRLSPNRLRSIARSETWEECRHEDDFLPLPAFAGAGNFETLVGPLLAITQPMRNHRIPLWQRLGF